MTEFTITYETLFDLLRKERNSSELQTLNPSFTQSVREYLQQKQAILAKSKTGELYQRTEQIKTEAQLKNIQKILKDLYDLREKKIVSQALNSSRTGSSLLHTASFQEHEKSLFEELTQLLEGYRDKALAFAEEGNTEQKEPAQDQPQQTPLPKQPEQPAPQTVQEKKPQDTLTILFLHSVPRFLGTNMEVLGPFEKGDKASLPADIANVLINKGRASLTE